MEELLPVLEELLELVDELELDVLDELLALPLLLEEELLELDELAWYLPPSQPAVKNAAPKNAR